MGDGRADQGERMPWWIHRQVRCGPVLRRVEGVIRREKLNTVCAGACCPNRSECFAAGTATFMIMGEVCTRDCRFCAVRTGTVRTPDAGEPEAVARAALALGLGHVVVTSVTRDDLTDGGAGHFARTIKALRMAVPDSTVEVLVPDFMGREGPVDTVLEAAPDVFNHNMETVKRLYPVVRREADYERSQKVLARAAQADTLTKSGFMVGLGESMTEVEELLRDLRRARCRMVTVGQYLRPTRDNLPVARYWEPGEFAEIERKARGMGFEGVAAGPLVRSSYLAEQMYDGIGKSRVSVG